MIDRTQNNSNELFPKYAIRFVVDFVVGFDVYTPFLWQTRDHYRSVAWAQLLLARLQCRDNSSQRIPIGREKRCVHALKCGSDHHLKSRRQLGGRPGFHPLSVSPTERMYREELSQTDIPHGRTVPA